VTCTNTNVIPLRPRFGMVPQRVFELAPQLRQRTMRVFVGLCGFADRNNHAWPSLAALGRRTKIDRRHVANEVGELVRRGLITRERRGKTNYYTVLHEAAGDTQAGVGQHPCDTEPGVRVTPAQVSATDTWAGAQTDHSFEQTIERNAAAAAAAARMSAREAPAAAQADHDDDGERQASQQPIAQQMFDIWNAKVILPYCQELTAERRKALRRCYRELGSDIERWRYVVDKVANSDFLTGSGPTGWRADLAWVSKAGSIGKVLEGAYDELYQRKGGGSSLLAAASRAFGTFAEKRRGPREPPPQLGEDWTPERHAAAIKKINAEIDAERFARAKAAWPA
jgi:Helix-turn-helix domain